MAKRVSDDIDNDRTDELPVLLEPVEHDGGADTHVDDTATRALPQGAVTALKIPTLEAQVGSLKDNVRELELGLAAKDARIAELEAVVARLREENADLSAYIEGRRQSWEQQQAAQGELEARAAALEQQLSEGAKRLAAAEAFAARESSRAVDLRAELVEYARRVDELERERRTERAPGAPQPAPADTIVAAQPTEAALADAAPAASGAAEQPAADAPVLTEAVDGLPPAVEVIAELEAEVEHKRQQIAAQLVELRDREQRLQTVTADLERVQRELASTRKELEERRNDVAQLERTVLDKDRAIEARDARIASLQEELQQRLRAAAKLEALDKALPTLHAPGGDATADSSVPALVCLTGDAPKRFAITKNLVTLGRGAQCDLQILTHFVSREHARITRSSSGTVIEDLGSRNGVFVNNVKVDKQRLQQGDLVTIGETQFRFVESMAH